MNKFLLTALCIISAFCSSAQTVNQNSGWFMLLNSTKLNEKWGLHFDAQLRSANEWSHLRNVLIRPGLTRYVSKNANATLGYLYTTTDNGANQNLLSEHRIWQQFIYNQKPWAGAMLAHRFRLEQRFIERPTDELFSQRLRYFFRLMQPLQKPESNFTKGIFFALQNELFFNLQNKRQLNGNFFDQNRAYLAAGYRFTKALDIEAGYLNQALKGANQNTINNALQVAFYTRF